MVGFEDRREAESTSEQTRIIVDAPLDTDADVGPVLAGRPPWKGIIVDSIEVGTEQLDTDYFDAPSNPPYGRRVVGRWWPGLPVTKASPRRPLSASGVRV
ncbi:MAG TPA: hypothetical protein VNO17_04125 [Actinomycetota bacterium]|nr:hypothetical protein [Actinomycetota bacterium]